MRTVSRLLICIYVVIIFTGAAAVSVARVYDYAELLTQNEEELLSEEAVKAISRTGVDFVILTVTDDHGWGPELYCDTFYEQGGFNINGVMLYVNMTERDVYLATYNDVVDWFGNADLNRILDVIAPILADGDYYGAGSYFISACISQIEYAKEHPDIYRPYTAPEPFLNVGMAALISLVIAIAAALILLMLHSRSLSPAPGIQSYFSGRGFRLTKSENHFLFTNTTRVAIPQNTNHGGGGRPGGGGGARITPSGGRAGGAGRKF